MNGMTFDLSCPTCGGDVEVVTVGRVILGREVSAIVRCCGKDGEWQIIVRVVPLVTRKEAPLSERPTRCGSEAGSAAHRRRGEPLCEPCRLAANIAQAARKAKARNKELVG